MKHAKRLCLLGLALSIAGSVAAQEAKPLADFAIVGARIEIGDGRVIENGTVVVRGGKIAEVTTSNKTPAGMDVVSAAGKTLYPGFIDAYSTRNLALPADGDLSVGAPDTVTRAPATMWQGNRKGVSPEVDASEVLSFDTDESAHKAGIAAALLVPGRGSIRGLGAVVNLLPKDAGERVVEPRVAMGMSFRGAGGGGPGGGGGGGGYPGNILGIIALMRQKLSDAQYYALYPEAEPVEAQTPKWLLGARALRPVVNGLTPVVFAADLDREIYRAFRLADEFKLRLILSGGRDAYLHLDEIKRRNVPVLLGLGIPSEPNTQPDKDDVPPGDAIPVEYRKERHANWSEQIQNAKKLFEGGVTVAFSSDGDTMSGFLNNVRRVIQSGVPRTEALKALTVNPANILRVSDRLGSIEVGKLANFTLMDGDFADAKTKVEMVWIAGNKVYEFKEEGR